MSNVSKIIGSIFLLPIIILGYYCARYPVKMAIWRNKGYYHDESEPTDFMIFLVRAVGIIILIISISILIAIFCSIIFKLNSYT